MEKTRKQHANSGSLFERTGHSASRGAIVPRLTRRSTPFRTNYPAGQLASAVSAGRLDHPQRPERRFGVRTLLITVHSDDSELTDELLRLRNEEGGVAAIDASATEVLA